MPLHASVITSFDLDTQIKRAELRRINAESRLLELKALNQRNLSSYQFGLPGTIVELPPNEKSVEPHWKLTYEPAANEIHLKMSAESSCEIYEFVRNLLNERWPKKSNN